MIGLPKVGLFSYTQTVLKSKTVRTRKRIRETEQKIIKCKPNILNPEEFIQEDYKKVQKLLKLAAKASLIGRGNELLLEKSCSTEAERELKEKDSKQKDDQSVTYSDSNPSISLSSSSKSSISASKSDASDKKQISNAEASFKLNKITGLIENSIKGGETHRKREIKDKLKVSNGLNDFMNLINQFNSPKMPQLLLKDFTKDESKNDEN